MWKWRFRDQYFNYELRSKIDGFELFYFDSLKSSFERMANGKLWEGEFILMVWWLGKGRRALRRATCLYHVTNLLIQEVWFSNLFWISFMYSCIANRHFWYRDMHVDAETIKWRWSIRRLSLISRFYDLIEHNLTN